MVQLPVQASLTPSAIFLGWAKCEALSKQWMTAVEEIGGVNNQVRGSALWI